MLGKEHGNHSWKSYFLRRLHLEMKMTKGRSGGYTCKSLRGHAGPPSLGSLGSLSHPGIPLLHDSIVFLIPSLHLDMCIVHQAGWWGWCTCGGFQPCVLTSGTAAPQSAAPLLMVQFEHGTSKMSVQLLQQHRHACLVVMSKVFLAVQSAFLFTVRLWLKIGYLLKMNWVCNDVCRC